MFVLAGVAALLTGVLWQLERGAEEPVQRVSSPSGAPEESVEGTAADTGAAGGSTDTRTAALRALHGWDERRAEAFARGDEAALRRLYAAGSRTGRADVALLRSYARRGLRVEDLDMQVIRLEVDHSSAEALDLVVVDRVTGARAVGGGHSIALPVDRASSRRIEMVRQQGEWLVDEVT